MESSSWIREAMEEAGALQPEIVRIVARKFGQDLAEDATSEAFLTSLSKPENLQRYAGKLGHRPTLPELRAFLIREAETNAKLAIRKVEGRQETGPRSFVSFDDATGVVAPTAPELEELERERFDAGEAWFDRLEQLLQRLPEDMRGFARLRLVEMAGPVDSRMSAEEAKQRLGLSDKGWVKRVRRLKALLATELQSFEGGGWCADYRGEITDLVLARALDEVDGPAALHLQHCGACNDFALHLMGGVRERAAAVLPMPELAGAGLFGTVAAKVMGWFSSGEGATTVAGGGAAGGGVLASGGAAVKACGVMAACAAVATPIVVTTAGADPEPPSAARTTTTPAPAVAAKPIATVAPVVATPSAAQVRSQERAMSRAASKAKRSARRDKRSSADAAFKVSSAARSARSAAPTQSDKALGLSSAPPAPSRSAPASAGSGGGGGGASDAPTSADKAFGLSTGGG